MRARCCSPRCTVQKCTDDEDDDEDENEQEPVAAVPAVADADEKQDEIPVFVPGLSVEQ